MPPCGKGIYIEWQHLIFLFMYMVQLYKEDWTILHILGCQAIALPSTKQIARRDPQFSKLKQIISRCFGHQQNLPKQPNEHRNLYNELSMDCGFLLKKSQMLIPTSMRNFMLEVIHEGHLGQERCILHARQAVYCPGISEDIYKLVESYETCKCFTDSQRKFPICRQE